MHQGNVEKTVVGAACTGGEVDPAMGMTRWRVESGPLRLEFGPADWREFSRFGIELHSPKRTGARVRLAILGPEERVLGHVTFAVDWVGANDMQLWLANFEPRGDAGRWAEIQAVVLEAVEPGWWLTELLVGEMRAGRAAPTWPVNESDTVIDGGWHGLMSRPDEWRLAEERSTVGLADLIVQYPSPWTQFGYRQTDDPGRLSMERAFDLDVGDYSQILGKMMWDKDAVAEITAVVDGGREIPLLEALDEWPDGWLTFGAPLEGAGHLDAVRMSLTERQERRVDGREIGMALFWLLLRRPSPLDHAPVEVIEARMAPTHEPYPAAVRTARVSIPQIPREEPPDSSTPVCDPLEDGLPFGFYVSREELPALRERALHGAARGIFTDIRAEADRALATEFVDRNYYGSANTQGGMGLPKGLLGAGMRVFGPTVALTHLITGEEQYAAACRRWILRAARSDDWRGGHGGCVLRPQIGDVLPYWDSFTGWYPEGFAGYMNHPFVVADVAFGVAVAYDMLYHCFGPDERQEVEQAFAEHGVYILYDKLLHARDYYVAMNQGALFALPLLMVTAFIKDRDRVCRRMHEFALEFLVEFGTRPWSPEGVCGEGPAYGVGTTGLYVEALPPLARCLGQPLEKVMPPSLPAVMDYIQHARSTWGADKPRFIGWSDGSDDRWASGEVLAFFARYARDPVAQYFWDESYAENPPANLTTLMTLGDPIEPAEPDLPPAKVFRDQPLAFLRTGWRHGDTLLAATNLRHVTGHGHQDRGSIVLEFGGEQLLLDPGMIDYSDPAAVQYEETFCHNTLTLSGRSQSGGTEAYDTAIAAFLSTSGPRCPGRDGGIDWVSLDAGAVYPELEAFVRHIVFLRPGVFVVCDEVKAKQPETMELNFTCLGPLAREGDLFVSSTERNHLLIHSQSTTPLQHEFVGWGTHWPEIPSYRLIRRTAEPVDRCTFVTVFAPHAIADPPPTVEALQIQGGLGVRVGCGEAEELFAVGVSGSAPALSGLETDAHMAAARTMGGRVIGAAMLRGTRLGIAEEGEFLRTEEPTLMGGVLLEGRWIVEEGK